MDIEPIYFIVLLFGIAQIAMYVMVINRLKVFRIQLDVIDAELRVSKRNTAIHIHEVAELRKQLAADAINLVSSLNRSDDTVFIDRGIAIHAQETELLDMAQTFEAEMPTSTRGIPPIEGEEIVEATTPRRGV